jgi:hypothetical protein
LAAVQRVLLPQMMVPLSRRNFASAPVEGLVPGQPELLPRSKEPQKRA